MTTYAVIVGNVGTVYTGKSQAMANRNYRTYIVMSQSNVGQAGGEPVTIMRDDEIWLEYIPPATDD